MTTLMIALAMNSGFRTTLQDRLLGVTAHINLSRPGSEGLGDYFALADKLGHTPGVKAVAPAIYLTLLLSSGSKAQGVVMKGIDPALEAKRNEALQRIVSGSADFTTDKDGFDSVVVGKMLASQMGFQVGDYVTLTSPVGQLTPFGMVPRTRRFRLAGIFDSGFYDYDANWCFVTLQAAQNLAGVGDVVRASLSFGLTSRIRRSNWAKNY